MNDNLQRAKKILVRINDLASITEEHGCVTRTYGSLAFVKGQSLVKAWMDEAGLQSSIDAIGNVRGKLVSNYKDAKTFVIGSHIDTVVDAGKFDGPLGVIMGIDLLENLSQSKITLPFNIELIAFCDEEGVRFQTTFLGSKAVSGTFDKNILVKRDKHEITLKEAIQSIGGDVTKIDKEVIPKDEWLGYFEIHIEQGPVLYQKNIPVALVAAIAGQCRVEITFTGVAGHAGTVPMDMRKDALCCASEFVQATEAFAFAHKDNLVATIGKLDIIHAASNVIPGKVVCSLDIRSADERILKSSIESVKRKCEEICNARNIIMTWKEILQTQPVICDEGLNTLLTQSITEKNYELVSLVSGAGHDAVPISEVAPVSMLFVRCFEGISHNPLENAELKDIAAAVEVSDHFLNQLILNNT